MRFCLPIVFVTAACGPPCRAVSAPASSVLCPSPRVGAPFTCTATVDDGRNANLTGRCLVSVTDGGIDLFVEGESCDRLPLPGPLQGVRCDLPPLGPGRWRLGTVVVDFLTDGGVVVQRP